MMRSLFSGVAGLKGHQTRMDVIGNNIANVNTTGFKSGRVTFQDTLSQTSSAASAPSAMVGGTNPKQIGLGVGVAGIDTIFTDGAIQSTGKNTDLCMSGEGLFIVKSGSETYYTRNGAFAFDYNGDYVLPGSGMYVQGWTADETGTLDMNSDIGKINVKAGKAMAAKATTQISFFNNLNAQVYKVKSVTGGIPVQQTTTSYTSPDDDGTTATVSSSTTIALTLADTNTVDGTLGSSYTVGDTYTATYDANSTTQSVTKSSDNTVTITLSDGSTIDDSALNAGTYAIGDTYPSGGATTISKIEYSSAISKMSVTTLECSLATSTNPVTVTLDDDDNTTLVYKSGSYRIGESLPLSPVLTVYDSLGAAHRVPIYFNKTGEGANYSEWRVSLQVGEAEEDSSAQDGYSIITTSEAVLETGVDGSALVSVKMVPITIRFDETGKIDTTYSTNRTAEFELLNGSEDPQKITVDFSNLTQFATGVGGDSTIRGDVDGYTAGTLKSVEVNNLGQLVGVYTNSERMIEGQVALAQFTNAAGLTKTGSSLYQESNNSGQATIGTASGFGVTITSAALEMSNVDIANEFSDMIVTQRGFQTNSKIITVSDEMLETLVNMKR